MSAIAPLGPVPGSRSGTAASPFRASTDEGSAWTYKLTLALLFVRLTYLHEILSVELGRNVYLMYAVGLPAVASYLVGGGIRKSQQYPIVNYWLALSVWMVLIVPFSYYRSDSLTHSLGYFKTAVIIVFLVSALHAREKALDGVLNVLFWSGLINLVTNFRYAGTTGSDRSGLGFGNMGNANDWAAHLLFMLPFLLLPAFLPRRPLWLRVLSVSASVVTLYAILSTASRGAAVALGVEVLVLLMMMSWHKRLALTLVALISFGVLSIWVSDAAFDRLWTLVEQSPGSDMGQESMESRKYYLQRSVDITLQHPIVGVGPGQFETALGAIEGKWKATHNSFTQISSETGLPGALLFLLGLGSTCLAIIRVRRLADKVASTDPFLVTIAVFVWTSAAGYTVAALFLNLAYTQYFPMMTALAVLLMARFARARAEAS